MFRSDDDKIVSISFDNREFLKNVDTTLKSIDELNNATSERNLNGKGLNTLSDAFTNLGDKADSSLSGIDNGFRRLSIPERIGRGLSELSMGFNALEAVALGALMNIGQQAANVLLSIPSRMMSGIRDGWSEYSLLIDSTQTILANTERYGTTIDDVTKSLDELNQYADLTIYNFAQMTRNMGYFTTSGMDLEEAQTMVTGMANLAALFGASNESLQRAMYQTSQAMSAGVIKKMDWNSLRNATMSGTLLQEELIRVAALMSGRSYDSMNDWINSVGGFVDSLEKGWLTSEIFEETMRRFAGMTREELEAIRDLQGNPLPDDEIDRIVELGEKGLEAAQVVRTLNQMLDSVKESIGSGWTETFRLIIGNLEQAKEFWSPINKLITEVTNGIGNWRNAIVKSWADVWRTVALEDMQELLSGISDIFKAIGTGIGRAFGSTHQIAGQIGRLTEALGDFATTLRLDEDELADLTDFTEGLLAPINLLLDIFRELIIIFFNAGDAMNEFDTRTDSLADNIRVIRKVILQAIGIFGRIMKAGLEFIRQNEGVKQGIDLVANSIKTVAGIVQNVLGKAIMYLYDIWERYNVSGHILNFCNIAITYLFKLRDAFFEIGDAIYSWFTGLRTELSQMRFANPLVDLKNILDALKEVFIAIVDPTKSVADAFETFKEVLGISGARATLTIWNVLGYIRDKLVELYEVLRNTPLGGVFDALADFGGKAFTIAQSGVDIVINAVTKLGDVLKKTKIWPYLTLIKSGFVTLYEKLTGLNIGGTIVGIVLSIKNSFETLMSSIDENGFIASIVTFIKNVKDSIESRITFRVPNVFTAIETVATDIHEATSKLTDFREFNGKLNSVRNTVSNVKGVLEALMPTESSKNASRGATVIKDILDFIEPVSGESTRISDKLKDVTNTLDNIADIDADKASDNAEKIALVIAGFVGIFKYLVNSFLTIVAVLSFFNFSKWSEVIKTALDDMTVAISNGFGGIAVAISNVAQTITKSLTAFSGAIKEKFRAEEFKAVAEIFKTIAILVGLIFVGITLVSQFGDPQALADTMTIFGVGLTVILGAISLTVLILMSEAKSIAKVCAASKASSLAVLGGLTIFTLALRRVITSITLMTAAIFAMAAAASQLENQDAFYDALISLTLIATFITTMITAVAYVFMRIGESTELLDLSGPFGTIKTVASITAAAGAMTSIMGAMSLLMLAFAGAVYVLTKAAINPILFDKVTGAIKILLFGLLGISALIALIGAVAPETSALFNNVALTMAGLALVTLAFGAAASGVVLAMGFVATELFGAASVFITVLSNVNNLDKVLDPLYKILLGVAITMGAMVIAMVTLSTLMSNMGSRAVAGIASMAVFAAAMFAMSQSLIVITTAVGMIVAISSKVKASRVDKAFTNLRSIFITVAVALGAITLLGAIKPEAMVSMMVAASAMLVASYTVKIIADAVRSIAETCRSTDINAATDSLLEISKTVYIIFGIIAAFSTITGPLGMAGVTTAATGMLLVASAIKKIGEAMKTGAEGFYRYAQAAKLLENVDVSAVYNKILRLADTIPAVISKVNESFGDIADMIAKGVRAVGMGIIQGIYDTYLFLSGLVTDNVAGVIEFFGGIIAGIVIGIVEVLRITVVGLCAENGPLREIINVLGDFAVDVADDLGYYGFKIVVGFIGGILAAIQSYGFDVMIGDALATWWANIELQFAKTFGFGNAEEMFAAIGSSWAKALGDNFFDIWKNFLDVIIIPGLQFIHDVGQMAGAVGGASYVFGNDIANAISNLEEYRKDLDDLTYYADIGFDKDRQDMADNAISRAQDAVDMARLLTEAEEEYIAARNQANQESRSGDSYYNPERYQGIADTISSIFNLGEGETIFGKIQDALGIGSGEGSIFEQISGAFGSPQTTGMSLLAQLAQGLGLGDLSDSTFSNPFTQAGEDAADAFDEGFTTEAAVNNYGSTVHDTDIDEDTLGKYAEALSAASDLPDEVKQPVIVPVLDDSGFKEDTMDLMNWWNEKTYDQFAIDTGNSMLLREKADGGEVTNGNVSISYTQINQSPKELSPIEIYRDTKNLLRGSGNFRLA